VFDRSQISKTLGLTTTIVKNWSDGKPFAITPSIRVSGKRGVQPLYSLNDFYLYAIARVLTSGGLTFDTVAQILPQMQSSWFAPDERGHLLVAQLNSGKPVVKHFSKRLSEQERQAGLYKELLLRENDDAHVYKLFVMLDSLDGRIKIPERHADKKSSSKLRK
jgi:hypothetical protein